MYSRPTAPKSIGGVLDDIFKLYGTAFKSCWTLALLSAAVVFVPAVMVGVKLSNNPAAAMEVFASPTVWLAYLAIFVGSIIFTTAIFTRTHAVASGESMSFGESLSRGASLFPRVFGTSFLYWLAIMVGLILLVIPGIYLMIALMLALPLIVAEDAGVTESLSRSRTLMKGDWWRTATILTIATLVAYLLLFAVGFVSALLPAIMRVDPIVVTVVSNVISSLLNVFIMPLYAATLLGVYYDLKVRKEGDDLADRVAALGKA